MSEISPTIAILGGTGGLGTGLARRWIEAGYSLILGSRSEEKAMVAADDLKKVMSERGIATIDVRAMENKAAAAAADICILTVPFAHHRSTLEQVKDVLTGKILVDVTVPLVPPKVMRVQLPAEGSAGSIAQEILGEDAHVVSAFQNVAAVHLQEGQGLQCDVIVCGNKKNARSEVIKLVQAAGMRGFHGGSIANSAATEALTSILIFLNKQYGGHAGISITGLEREVLDPNPE